MQIQYRQFLGGRVVIGGENEREEYPVPCWLSETTRRESRLGGKRPHSSLTHSVGHLRWTSPYGHFLM